MLRDRVLRSPYASALIVLVSYLDSAVSQNYGDTFGGAGQQLAQEYMDRVEYADDGHYSDYAASDQNVPYNRNSWSIAHQPNFKVSAAIMQLNYTPTWVPDWPAPSTSLGQVSAVALDTRGRVVVFHRSTHTWTYETFTLDNRYRNIDEPPISKPTVAVFNGTTGEIVQQWGQDLFYLPHGLTIDSKDNVWVTDVALHQVMKFTPDDRRKPNMTLGVRFIPGKDNLHFCKPSGVAVMESGEFFVSDGYCNTRIIKYSPAGQFILQWGRNTFQGNAHVVPQPYFFAIPHALALAEDKDLVCVADRENGRVQCFNTRNGTFVSQFHSPVIGARVFSVAYSPVNGGQLYVVNGVENAPRPIRGFVINIATRRILSQFGPDNKDFSNPHDVAVSRDGREIYVVELDPYKVFKFVDKTVEVKTAAAAAANDTVRKQRPTETKQMVVDKKADTTLPPYVKPTATVEGLSIGGSSWGGWAGVAGGVAGGLGAVLLLLLGGAALLLRARHRGGCLSPLTPRNRRQRWDYAPGAPDFKLRHLLERPRVAGFERINTEESDEEPTSATSMLTPQNA